MAIIKQGKTLLTQLSHASTMSPDAFIFRVWQAISLSYLYRTNYWPKLEKQIQLFWNSERVNSWMDTVRNGHLLIGPAKLAAYRKWIQEQPQWHDALLNRANELRSGRFLIFDRTYQFDWQNLPWHTDWRYGYTWPPAYYKTYRYSETDKSIPYDVKYPWELSRFAFLFPMALTGMISDDLFWYASISQITSDWEQKNPLAYSVNWQPMISAIHGISVALTAQMLASDPRTQVEHLAPLLRQLSLHGEFLIRNLEYTTIRANHYTSNLIGLLVMGTTISRLYPRAQRWVDYAVQRIEAEVLGQYCSDGVNFEKTVSYHRLVTEFFLLGLLFLKHTGHPVAPEVYGRILQACEYVFWYTRPDSFAPNLGDNDGAWLLAFDPRPTRDHRSLLAFAAAYFGEAKFKQIAQAPSAAIPLLLGQEGVDRWCSLHEKSQTTVGARYFKEGGMLIARSTKNYLVADYGEVGKSGTGGHGHNDTFSFELCLDGEPVIIDAGCPTYTGDRSLWFRFSGTSAHNTARIDEEEIAPIRGMWRIANDAAPRNVVYTSDGNIDLIQGEHYGYTRLTDPVIHQRTLSFDRIKGHLRCTDRFFCRGDHIAEQFLHFSPSVTLEMRKSVLYARLTTDTVVEISWLPIAEAYVETIQVSPVFGQLIDSQRLVLRYSITGITTLSYIIALSANRQY